MPKQKQRPESPRLEMVVFMNGGPLFATGASVNNPDLTATSTQFDDTYRKQLQQGKIPPGIPEVENGKVVSVPFPFTMTKDGHQLWAKGILRGSDLSWLYPRQYLSASPYNLKVPDSHTYRGDVIDKLNKFFELVLDKTFAGIDGIQKEGESLWDKLADGTCFEEVPISEIMFSSYSAWLQETKCGFDHHMTKSDGSQQEIAGTDDELHQLALNAYAGALHSEETIDPRTRIFLDNYQRGIINIPAGQIKEQRDVNIANFVSWAYYKLLVESDDIFMFLDTKKNSNEIIYNACGEWFESLAKDEDSIHTLMEFADNFTKKELDNYLKNRMGEISFFDLTKTREQLKNEYRQSLINKLKETYTFNVVANPDIIAEDSRILGAVDDLINQRVREYSFIGRCYSTIENSNLEQSKKEGILHTLDKYYNNGANTDPQKLVYYLISNAPKEMQSLIGDGTPLPKFHRQQLALYVTGFMQLARLQARGR